MAYDDAVWDKIRQDADRGLTPSRLAEIHKPVSRTAIIRRAKLEDWKNTRASIDARAHARADGIARGQTVAEAEAATYLAESRNARLAPYGHAACGVPAWTSERIKNLVVSGFVLPGRTRIGHADPPGGFISALQARQVPRHSARRDRT